jgi:hypothetical protein
MASFDDLDSFDMTRDLNKGHLVLAEAVQLSVWPESSEQLKKNLLHVAANDLFLRRSIGLSGSA